MDYQDLINAWNTSDMELEKKITLNRKLVKEVAFKKIRSSLFEIKWSAFFHVFVGFFWIIFLVRFSFGHMGEFRFLAPALILMGISFFSLILEGKKLYLYYTIDSDNSVLQTQEKLAQLKYLQLRDINSLYVIIPLFSGLFFIVIAKALLNLDLFIFDSFGKILLYYTMGSLVVAGILVYFLTAFPNKRLKAANEFLKELREME